MKEFDEILIDTLYNRADSEQNVANRLYEGRSSNESYFIAAVTAQVLRNVAGALEQAKNIDRGVPKGMMKYMKDVYAPERAVDPDIFREKLEKLVKAIENYEISEKTFLSDEVESAMQNAERALDEHPISPARKVQAKYDRLLKQCLEDLKHCEVFISTRERMNQVGIDQHKKLIELLEEVLAE